MPSSDPTKDSTNVVVHARKSIFVLFIVSGLILVTTLFQEPRGLGAAIDELESIIETMSRVKKDLTDISEEPVPLATVLLGDDAPTNVDYEVYRITFDYFEDFQVPYARRPTQAEGTCTVAIDKNATYFVTEDGHVEHLVVGERGDVRLGSRLGDNLVPSSLSSLVPASVLGYKKLWNWFSRSRKRARVEWLDERGRAVLFPPDDRESVLYIPFSQSVKKLDEYPAAWTNSDVGSTGRREPVVPTGADTFIELREEHLRGVGLGLTYVWRFVLSVLVPDYEFPELIDWERDPDHKILVGHCFPDDAGKFAQAFRVAVRARVKFTSSDWSTLLFERASDLQEQLGRVPSFNEAYPNLNRWYVGHEGKNYGALHKVLTKEMPPDVKTVSFFEVTVPFELLHDSGIVLILLCQIYATLHLIEVRRRMEHCALGDPGAFVPWILLYSQEWARTISLLLLAVPAFVIVWILSLSVLTTLGERPNGDVGVLFWLVCKVASVSLTICSWQVWGSLNSRAKEHRGTDSGS